MEDQSRCRLEPELEVTDKIREAIKKSLKCREISDDLKRQCCDILGRDKDTARISTKLIREIYNTLRDNGQKVFLHDIVEGAILIPQSVKLPPRDPVLEARVQKLKIDHENEEYKRITRNVDPRAKKVFTFKEEVKVMNRQILAVVNFLITVGAGFAFGYKGVELAVGRIFPLQMMTGLVIGNIVFFVDLYFLLRYGF